MSRRQRLHVPGGTYYIVQRGGLSQPIFGEPDDYVLFERLLANALRRTESRVHGYCWTPDEIHLALEIGEISVGRFMQGLTSRYARCIQKRTGASGHFFAQRYRATLIDPGAYLVKLIGYVHFLPVLSGLAGRPDDYVHSSFAAHTSAAVIPWLTTRATRRAVERSGGSERLLLTPPTPEDIQLFTQGGRDDARVIGGPAFLASIPRCSRVYRSTASLDQIIETVVTRLGLERERVLSKSRERELSLARALIGWYAVERGVATLSEAARRLRRDPSTLSLAITRYRTTRPELFKLERLHDVTPLIRIETWESAMDRRPEPDSDRKTA